MADRGANSQPAAGGDCEQRCADARAAERRRLPDEEASVLQERLRAFAGGVKAGLQVSAGDAAGEGEVGRG